MSGAGLGQICGAIAALRSCALENQPVFKLLMVSMDALDERQNGLGHNHIYAVCDLQGVLSSQPPPTLAPSAAHASGRPSKHAYNHAETHSPDSASMQSSCTLTRQLAASRPPKKTPTELGPHNLDHAQAASRSTFHLAIPQHRQTSSQPQSGQHTIRGLHQLANPQLPAHPHRAHSSPLQTDASAPSVPSADGTQHALRGRPNSPHQGPQSGTNATHWPPPSPHTDSAQSTAKHPIPPSSTSIPFPKLHQPVLSWPYNSTFTSSRKHLYAARHDRLQVCAICAMCLPFVTWLQRCTCWGFLWG